MNGQNFLFSIFFLLACGGAIAVVVTQNVVRMAFWLVVSLGSVAGLFFLLHADFVGATQLMIYVGGTIVLLIFGVMLTGSGPVTSIRTSPADGFLAAGVGVLLLAMFFFTVIAVDWEHVKESTEFAAASESSKGYNPEATGNTARPIGLKLLGISVEDLNSERGGQRTGFLLPFEIVSVHLLVVLIGAAYLARAKRRADQTTES
jgi:NADH:ubiquinone oxidoreductase subunit 6 (subunit J)